MSTAGIQLEFRDGRRVVLASGGQAAKPATAAAGQCVVCGRFFGKPVPWAKTCGKACRREHNLERLREISRQRKAARECRPCAICGQEFRPRNCRAKTCGEECCREYNRQYKAAPEWREKRRRWEPRRPPTSRSCVVCGRVFRQRNSLHKTCGKECSREYDLQRKHDLQRKRSGSPHRRHPLPVSRCAVCGRFFRPQVWSAKTCSETCRKEHKKAWALRYKATPEYRENAQRFRNTPKHREYMKKYHATPEARKRKREYFQRPEIRERRRKAMRQYFQRPEIRDRELDRERRLYRFRRAAALLGLPPLLYAALKIVESQPPEEPHDPNRQ